MAPRTPLAERFWTHVPKTEGCWIWNGSRDRYGYGVISRGGRKNLARAHRISWELHFGLIPAGLLVLHHCDTRPCVRPDHLFIGTHADNSTDMRQKGRSRPGTMKLTAANVANIRLAAGISHRALAQAYGVNQSTVTRIKNGQRW